MVVIDVTVTSGLEIVCIGSHLIFSFNSFLIETRLCSSGVCVGSFGSYVNCC